MKPIKKYLNTKSQWHPRDLSNYCVILPFSTMFSMLDKEQHKYFVKGSKYSFNIWVLPKSIAKTYVENPETFDSKYYIYSIPDEYDDIEEFKKDYINGKFPNDTLLGKLPEGLHQIFPEQL